MRWTLGPWRHYLALYRGSARDLALATAGSVTQSLLLVPVALLVREAFDHAMPAGDVTALTTIGFAIGGLYVVSGGVSLASRHLSLRTTKRATASLRDELVQKVFTLPRDTIVRSDSSQTHSTIVHDTERVDVMSYELVNQVLPAIVFGTAIAVLLAYMNLVLFLAVAAITPVLTIVLRVISHNVRRRVHEFHMSFNTFSRGILFLLQRWDLTRTMSAEHIERERRSREITDLERISADVSWWRDANNVAQETITSASWALILVIGGVAVATGRMTIGDVLAFSVAAVMLKRSVNAMVLGIPLIVEGRESLHRLFEFAGQPDDVSYRGTERIAFDGRITAEAVHFSYTGQPLLEGIEFETAPGRWAVITGPSGSGKTTLLYVILGLYRPVSGRLLADDRPYDDIDLSALRRQIGFVPQDPIVFSGTVLENICYGTTESSESRAREAARLAMADGFIDELPQRYQTVVGEGGALLSGGQRQRLTLARAFYRRPRLLLLDEPTNQLDEATADAIYGSLRKLPGSPSIVVVTHDDRAALRYADELHTFSDGRLIRQAVPARMAVA